jgi:hypothetical protein
MCGATRRGVRLIGRERGYHGVGFGGIAVGGIVNNRKQFGALVAGVDHLPTTYNREKQAFTVGEPEWALILPMNSTVSSPARRVNDCGGDCRAGGGVDRRAAPPKELSRTAACDLRQARNSPDLRRG